MKIDFQINKFGLTRVIFTPENPRESKYIDKLEDAALDKKALVLGIAENRNFETLAEALTLGG